MRLDAYLAKESLVPSREKARALILEGQILVDGKAASKPSMEVIEGVSIELLSPSRYVGRAALKLQGFLESYPEISLKGERVLDIGSSTGGFAQVALQAGALSVTCVDVGRDQLAKELREDSRIALFEGMDIRDFQDEPFNWVLCDVSFISLSKVLPDIYRLCAQGAILLFKPQFEVGREAKRNRKGVVVEADRIHVRLKEFGAECERFGFKVDACEPSKTKGKEGNEEFFLYIRRS